MPLYQLLGGASRTGVMVYGHANGRDIEQTVDEVLRYQSAWATRRSARRAACRGWRRSTASAAARMFYEPADADLPSEHDWSTEKYLRHMPQAVRGGARGASAPTSHLLHDVHHRLTPIEAARLGKDLEPYRLFWMEDATPAENQEAFRLIRQHTTTPLAVGEVFNTHLGLQGPDPEPAHRLHPHDRRARRRHHAPAAHRRPRGAVPGAHRLPRRHRPVAGVHGRGAALRPVGAELRHPGVHAPHRRDRRRLPARLHASRTASCTRARRPATASTIDEALAAKYPYQRAYLPVNRLQHDGTLWHW